MGKGARTAVPGPAPSAGAPGAAPTAAVGVLVQAKVAYRLHRYEHDPSAPSYGGEAAAVLGVDPARVHKTLVATAFDASAAAGRLVVAVVPVAGQLDLKALATACGARRAAMAEAAAAERATGYVVGGISPLGHRRRLPVVVDEAALGWETVFVSAGRRGLEVELAATDLVRLAGAVTAAIAR